MEVTVTLSDVFGSFIIDIGSMTRVILRATNDVNACVNSRCEHHTLTLHSSHSVPITHIIHVTCTHRQYNLQTKIINNTHGR